jgi:hypothetical protein
MHSLLKLLGCACLFVLAGYLTDMAHVQFVDALEVVSVSSHSETGAPWKHEGVEPTKEVPKKVADSTKGATPDDAKVRVGLWTHPYLSMNIMQDAHVFFEALGNCCEFGKHSRVSPCSAIFIITGIGRTF